MNPRELMSRMLLLGLLTLALSPAAFADAENTTNDADTIAALKIQLEALTARLEAVESREKIRIDTYEAPVTATAAPASASWTDRIKMKGDFRYRHETIDADFADNTRHRNRIRARPALTAKVNDSVEVGFGLATGGEDPTSSNQTLGDSFSSKNIVLDLAYFDWDTQIDGLSITGGKYKNPVHRTGGNGLIWDGDLRPEGMFARYENSGFRFSGLFNWVSESSSKDSLAFGGQADWSTNFGDNKLLLGAGYYDLTSVKGQEVPLDGDPRGNSVDALNRYLYGYEELELFGEFSFNVGKSATKLFFNYVENLDADEFEQGWAIGGEMNFKQGRRPWKIGYTYQDLEADAVFALFSDSDFIGGGTDGKGHILRGSYGLTKNVSLGGTLFITERGKENTGVSEDYNRLMLDVAFKY